MKKVLTLTAVLVLAACGFSQNQVAQHDARFAGCERVETTWLHLVYKCPSDMEWIQEAKKQEPNAMFKQGSILVRNNVNADIEHTYVEVVPGRFRQCKDFHYRVMIRPFDAKSKEYFAFAGC